MRVVIFAILAVVCGATQAPTATFKLIGASIRASFVVGGEFRGADQERAGLRYGLIETNAHTLLPGADVFTVVVNRRGTTRRVPSSALVLVNVTQHSPVSVEAHFIADLNADMLSCSVDDAQHCTMASLLHVRWSACLRFGATVRQSVVVAATAAAWLLEEIVFVSAALPLAHLLGSAPAAKGQMLVLAPGLFAGVEHPLADNHHGARALVLGSVVLTRDHLLPLRIDVTGVLLAAVGASFSYLVWVDNWESALPLWVDGVQLVTSDGAVVSEDWHEAHVASNDTRANIFSLPDIAASATLAYTLVLAIRLVPGIVYTAPIIYGINRLDRAGHVTCSYRRQAQLPNDAAGSDARWEVGFVVGAFAPGQLRRAIHAYVDDARPRAAAINLHWNSWYTLGTGKRFDDAEALAAIAAIGRELVQKRHVRLDSFLLDDGWDDLESLWHFHAGFPDGLFPAQRLAGEYGARVGVWLSPWGGYAGRQTRLHAAAAEGFETRGVGDQEAFDFHAPRYYARFSNITMDFVDRYSVNMFKFDGIGAPSRYGAAHPAFTEDFEAMMRLLGVIRARNTSVFINLSTGTWPSVFWLLHVDCIWRGGHDHEFIGDSSQPPRERWITYRDTMAYQNVVLQSPMFPLAQLMLHGIIRARDAWDLNEKTTDAWHFRNEVRSAFGSGATLQELYVTPSLMSSTHWDDVAAAATWARAAAVVLRDVRWVGGNPAHSVVYGWAAGALSPASKALVGAVLTLRNPASRSALFVLGTLAAAFELEAETEAAVAWPVCLQAPLLPQRLLRVCFDAPATALAIELGPLEVLVFSLQ